jgi:ribonuclease J
VSIDQQTGKLGGDADVISRGFVFENEAGDLLNEAKTYVKSLLMDHDRKITDWRFIRKLIEERLAVFLYKATERRPLILPVVVEV